MKKEDFLKRCETIWDLGFVDPKLFSMLRSASEVYGRLRHVYKFRPERFSTIGKEGCGLSENVQGSIAMQELTIDKDTPGFGNLAGDEAYKLTQMVSILAHPCQDCAEDKNAWHTRYGFCEHRG